MPYSSPFLCSLGVASIADYQNLDYVLNYVQTNLVSSGDFRRQITMSC